MRRESKRNLRHLARSRRVSSEVSVWVPCSGDMVRALHPIRVGMDEGYVNVLYIWCPCSTNSDVIGGTKIIGGQTCAEIRNYLCAQLNDKSDEPRKPHPTLNTAANVVWTTIISAIRHRRYLRLKRVGERESVVQSKSRMDMLSALLSYALSAPIQVSAPSNGTRELRLSGSTVVATRDRSFHWTFDDDVIDQQAVVAGMSGGHCAYCSVARSSRTATKHRYGTHHRDTVRAVVHRAMQLLGPTKNGVSPLMLAVTAKQSPVDFRFDKNPQPKLPHDIVIVRRDIGAELEEMATTTQLEVL